MHGGLEVAVGCELTARPEAAEAAARQRVREQLLRPLGALELTPADEPAEVRDRKTDPALTLRWITS